MNARGIRFRRSGPFAQKPAMRKILGSDGSRAFTLIEMITVVGIIMILSILAISNSL